MDKANNKRYGTVFLITLIIFVFTLWLSNEFGNKRVERLKDLEGQISLNILSTETRFSLLEKTSCAHVLENKDNKIGLNNELSDLARRIKFTESQLGQDNKDVVALKKYYTLLQIKDYLLLREFHTRCNEKMVSILYFHESECKDCPKQSLILDKVTEEYPAIRVYWFDKNIDTPALETLLSLFKIKTGPSLVINEKTYEGLQNFETLEQVIPETKILKKEKELLLKNATSTLKETK
jgi:thiol-disulfide isomerase/thioredoxin